MFFGSPVPAGCPLTACGHGRHEKSCYGSPLASVLNRAPDDPEVEMSGFLLVEDVDRISPYIAYEMGGTLALKYSKINNKIAIFLYKKNNHFDVLFIPSLNLFTDSYSLSDSVIVPLSSEILSILSLCRLTVLSDSSSSS